MMKTAEIISIPAKAVSYEPGLRDKKKVKYIAIHNTGNDGDTAENNGKYFAGTNARKAGAHFFIDRKGKVVKSVAMNRTAYAVGGSKYNTGGGKYYKACTNANSVSIELCDIVKKYPSQEQITATKELIAYIRKNCPNARTVIRHYDVNGKPCPAKMVDAATWKKFLKDIGER